MKRISKIEYVPIWKVKNNPNNPRLVKDDKFKKLVKSIKDFPDMLDKRPIIVNADLIVLGGNMRLKACNEAGLKEVPIIVAEDWTEEQQKAFIIKDNLGYGEWDWDMIANEWDIDEITEWGLDLPDFNKEVQLDDADDLSSEIKSLYRIEIICSDEEHQENTYNKLIEQGYECRLLTL